MEYINPITDRSLQDVQSGKTKGFFNVSDWERITNNLVYARGLVEAEHGVALSFEPLPAVTMETIPTAENVNKLVENLRSIGIASAIGIEEEFENYVDGGLCPDYQAVNSWERAIDRIIRHYQQITTGRIAVTGVSVTGTRKQFRYRKE